MEKSLREMVVRCIQYQKDARAAGEIGAAEAWDLCEMHLRTASCSSRIAQGKMDHPPRDIWQVDVAEVTRLVQYMQDAGYELAEVVQMLEYPEEWDDEYQKMLTHVEEEEDQDEEDPGLGPDSQAMAEARQEARDERRRERAEWQCDFREPQDDSLMTHGSV